MSFRHKALIFGLIAGVALGGMGEAFARAGGSSSSGSRGSRTFSAPAPTNTAPGMAAPMQRSMTPQSTPSSGPNMAQPSNGGLFGGSFGRGMMGGLMGGLLGAGLFGLLFGHGLMGGFGGFSSIIGLIIQAGLLFLLFKLVMGFIRNRQRPAYQGMPAGAAAYDAGPGAGNNPAGNQASGQASGGFFGFGGGSAARNEKLDIKPEDFNAFEQKLSEIQTAYSAEDLEAIRSRVTPEMASYFAEEIAANARKGLVNRLSETKLLQGDLSEAWREASSDYATVAMRFSLIDTMVDRASGRVVSGNSSVQEEATEIWTFERPRGGTTADWKLSAIQQVK
jgi:predicted lipid-binding transport protein (Tim44 family)